VVLPIDETVAVGSLFVDIVQINTPLAEQPCRIWRNSDAGADLGNVSNECDDIRRRSTSVNSFTASRIVTRCPSAARANAVAKPPIPAPTIMTSRVFIL